jgi:hypothetical protein
MANGSFNLEITFSGLCMFVPAKDKSRMHVLMPVSGKTLCGVHVHQHVNRLYYHPSYETGTGSPTKPTKPRFLELNGEALELKFNGNAETTLKPGIVNVSSITKKGVRSSLLTGQPTDPIGARVTMFAGRFGSPNDGLIWDIEGNECELSSVVPWTIPDVPEDSITFTLGGMSRTLRPIDGKVSIYMFNLPPDEVPRRVPLRPPPPFECPQKDAEATHFAGYYYLLGCPGSKLPKFKKGKFAGQCSPPTHNPRATVEPRASRAAEIEGVRPVICMTAGGEEGGS